MESATSEHLPEDIIVQILLRLPVKPLLRFRCVSKRWGSIISEPKFAKSQFQLASQLKTLSQRLLISNSSGLEAPSCLDESPARKLTYPFKQQPERAVELIGACNGMVCVGLNHTDSFYIWNPSTGMYRKLPRPGFAVGQSLGILHCGFGYVSATDDYNVVVCPAAFFWAVMPLEIYSYRKNSWTRVPTPNNFAALHSEAKVRGALANEALHWIEYLDGRHLVVALDLAKYTFIGMTLPFKKVYSTYVGVVCGGSLCVSSHDGLGFGPLGSEYVQLWVMTEYGVSWNKLFKFRRDGQLEHPILCRERGMVMLAMASHKIGEIIRFDNRGEEEHDKVVVCSSRYTFEKGKSDLIEYDESLLWLPDCPELKEIKKLENPTQAQMQK